MANLIGTAPNQVPTNGLLGNMAFQNKEAVSVDTLVTTALTVGSATAGSVLFAGASGAVSQDNANLFWDDTNNRLGIGTNAPTLQFQVGSRGGMSSNGVFQWGSALTGNARGVLSWNTDLATIGSPLNLAFCTNSETTERMRLDTSGNLGIGTTSTSSWRTRISNTTNQTLSLQNSAGTGTRIQLVDTTWGGEIEQNAGAMIFKIGGTTEAMRIASDGKVGIGTTGATALLDVNADTVRVRTAKTPASATATGNAGDICWDSNYVYVCVATNTWKRSALSTW